MVGAPGVLVDGKELPEPTTPLVVLPPIVLPDVPSAFVPLGDVPVVLSGSEVVVFLVTPPVVPMVPPVVLGNSPVVVLGVVEPGVMVVVPVVPRLDPPPPVPRPLLPLPTPTLPPTAEPPPALPPAAPPAPPPLPAASASGLANISIAAVSAVVVVNRVVLLPVMRITCDVVPTGGPCSAPPLRITDRVPERSA